MIKASVEASRPASTLKIGAAIPSLAPPPKALPTVPRSGESDCQKVARRQKVLVTS